MLKRVKKKKLGRTRGARHALLRVMARQLLTLGAIETTEAKAKVLKSYIDALLKKSQIEENSDLKKKLSAKLGVNSDIASFLATQAAKTKPGSKTRILRLVNRLGDHATLARIELITN